MLLFQPNILRKHNPYLILSQLWGNSNIAHLPCAEGVPKDVGINLSAFFVFNHSGRGNSSAFFVFSYGPLNTKKILLTGPKSNNIICVWIWGPVYFVFMMSLNVLFKTYKIQLELDCKTWIIYVIIVIIIIEHYHK